MRRHDKMHGLPFFRNKWTFIFCEIFQWKFKNLNFKNDIPEDPVFGTRINHGNNFFSKLFNRGLECINKVFEKSFWSQKFNFKTRINGQENFFFDFFFHFFTCLSTSTKYENRAKSIIFT
jgi:hypothetical protein